jgi:hypothetical protein
VSIVKDTFGTTRQDIEQKFEQKMQELEQSNALWGWIAGGVTLALLLVFHFASQATRLRQSFLSHSGAWSAGPRRVTRALNPANQRIPLFISLV